MILKGFDCQSLVVERSAVVELIKPSGDDAFQVQYLSLTSHHPCFACSLVDYDRVYTTEISLGLVILLASLLRMQLPARGLDSLYASGQFGIPNLIILLAETSYHAPI